MLEKIAQILRNYKENEDLEITESTSFKELDLDSLDTVELIMNIEDQFDVTIEMDGGINTVGDLINIINQLKG